MSKIPEVSNSVGGAAAVLRSMGVANAASSPSLLAQAREKARVSAQEKMTPNFDLEKEQQQQPHEVEPQEDLVEFIADDDQDEEEAWDECVRQVKRAKSVSKERKRQLFLDDDMKDNGNVSAVTDDDEDEYLPLNNVVDWDEWNATGTFTTTSKSKPPKSRPTSPKLKAKYLRKMTGKATSSSGNGSGNKKQSSKKNLPIKPMHN